MSEGDWGNGEVFVGSIPINEHEYEEDNDLARSRVESPPSVEGVSRLRARASSTTTVELYWRLDLDLVPAGANILIERALGDAGFSTIATIPLTDTSFIDSGLAAGTRYRYRVTVI